MDVLRNRRVLIVDDEPLIRLLVADDIEEAGGSTVEAGDGAEAVALLEQGLDVDALITDIRMPRMDGWTLAERARALRPDLPVLYVTGYSDVIPRPVPSARVLSKPFGTRAVSAALTDVIAASGRAAAES